jgi:hypothetical protein
MVSRRIVSRRTVDGGRLATIGYPTQIAIFPAESAARSPPIAQKSSIGSVTEQNPCSRLGVRAAMVLVSRGIDLGSAGTEQTSGEAVAGAEAAGGEEKKARGKDGGGRARKNGRREKANHTGLALCTPQSIALPFLDLPPRRRRGQPSHSARTRRSARPRPPKQAAGQHPNTF